MDEVEVGPEPAVRVQQESSVGDLLVRYARVSVFVVAGAVMWGSALLPAQANAPTAAETLKPANVVYQFNKIKPGGIVRDVSPPTNRQMVLRGNWKRATAANGTKKAVAFRARSIGVIKRSATLIPKRRAFAVSMVVKVRKFVGNDSPNLAQVGFYRQKGQWKVEVLPNSGYILFRVKGTNGAAAVASRVSIDDGKYHLVTCYRKKGEIGVIIDGVKRTRSASTGSVLSPRNVTIANKHSTTAEDQFRGNFDYFSIALGRQSVARSIAKAPAIR